MNRLQQFGAGVAVGLTAAVVVAFVAFAAPEPVKSSVLAGPAKSVKFRSVCNYNSSIPRDPLWMRQSFENDRCWAPQEPAVLDGFTVNRSRLEVGMRAARDYIASADQYQKCISDYLASQRLKSVQTGHPLKRGLVMIETQRIVASQESKKRVNDAIAMAINDFNEYGSECPD